MIVVAEWNIFHTGQGLSDKGMPLMTVYLTHLMEKKGAGDGVGRMDEILCPDNCSPGSAFEEQSESDW